MYNSIGSCLCNRLGFIFVIYLVNIIISCHCFVVFFFFILSSRNKFKLRNRHLSKLVFKKWTHEKPVIKKKKDISLYSSKKTKRFSSPVFGKSIYFMIFKTFGSYVYSLTETLFHTACYLYRSIINFWNLFSSTFLFIFNGTKKPLTMHIRKPSLYSVYLYCRKIK